MNMKELGFAPALAFERSGLSNDPLTDVEVSKEYIATKWDTTPYEEGEDTQGNVQDHFIRGYWRNRKGQGDSQIEPQKPVSGDKGGESDAAET